MSRSGGAVVVFDVLVLGREGPRLPAGLTAARATPQRAWPGAASAVVLQRVLADLGAAYRNFFASVAGRRKGAEGRPAPVPVR